MKDQIIKNIAAWLLENDSRFEAISEVNEEVLEAAEEWFNDADAEDGEPSLYVGTYGKYNDGNLFGMWIRLAAFDSKDDFLTFCAALHSDEYDPEFMNQDFMYFPEAYYSESCIDDDDFDKILEYANLDEDDRNMLEAYCCATGNTDATIDDARDAFVGQYDSDAYFAVYIQRYGLRSPRLDRLPY